MIAFFLLLGCIDTKVRCVDASGALVYEGVCGFNVSTRTREDGVVYECTWGENAGGRAVYARVETTGYCDVGSEPTPADVEE